MKLPTQIDTLKDMTDWVVKLNPKVIEVTPKSKILNIRQFSTHEWKIYRGIPIKYQAQKKKTKSQLVRALIYRIGEARKVKDPDKFYETKMDQIIAKLRQVLEEDKYGKPY